MINFLLRDKSNPASVISNVKAARDNARLVRTALTREVWEATNEAWITLQALLARPVRERDLPDVLSVIRQQKAVVRGAMAGTMLRNDGYNFARLGMFLERADNTARILDVKYYLLLPSFAQIGSSLDQVQWETILRSVSARRAYRWLYGTDISPMNVAEFLILHPQMPRSLAFCSQKIMNNLGHLEQDYGVENQSCRMAKAHYQKLKDSNIDGIFEQGLHEFVGRFPRRQRRARLADRTRLQVPGIAMRLTVNHSTSYLYDAPVDYGLQQVRLTPKEREGQKILHWDISIEGGHKELHFTDHHANHVDLISIDPGGERLVIHVTGEVETADTAGVIGPHRGFMPLWMFKRPTALTTPGPKIRALLKELGGEYDNDIARAHALSALIVEHVPYATGKTDADTGAEQAVSHGAGVCQDHAHIFITAMRLLGHPARYVSGYLMMNDRAEQDATHAWAEAWFDRHRLGGF